MSERKLPDPPAYDPRVEQADNDDELLFKRAVRIYELAVDECNPFLCALLVRNLSKTDNGSIELERLAADLARQLSHASRSTVPFDVREALGLE